MCVAVPGKIIEIRGTVGIVDYGGIRKEAELALLEDAKVGDYVLVHTGYAIERIPEQEAKERLEEFRKIGEALRE